MYKSLEGDFKWCVFFYANKIVFSKDEVGITFFKEISNIKLWLNKLYNKESIEFQSQKYKKYIH